MHLLLNGNIFNFMQNCFPGNASLVSEGILGQSGKVMRTYIFHDRIYLDPYEVTITVIYSGTILATFFVTVCTFFRNIFCKERICLVILFMNVAVTIQRLEISFISYIPE